VVGINYLQKGLNGLANAHRANAMAGHLGAALVAGYLFSQDQPSLDERVYCGIEGELERVLGGEEAFWFSPAETGITVAELFAFTPDEPPCPVNLSSIATALDSNVDRTRQSGHNVIFAALAIRALTQHPALATPTVIEGIRGLISLFDGAHREHLRLWRSLPDVSDELGPVKRAAGDPLTPGYWADPTLKRDQARLTHRIKTLYGYYRLAPLIRDESTRAAADAALLWLMA